MTVFLAPPIKAQHLSPGVQRVALFSLFRHLVYKTILYVVSFHYYNQKVKMMFFSNIVQKSGEVMRRNLSKE